MRLFRGSLYKKYPGMLRKTLSNDERKRLADSGLSSHLLASSVSLLRAIEVDEVIEGNDEKYIVSVQGYLFLFINACTCLGIKLMFM